MCKYCQIKKDTFAFVFKKEILNVNINAIITDDDYLSVEVDGLGRTPKEINKKISYCPMCGQKLNERI